MAHKLPSSIKIGNRTVKVKVVDFDAPSHRFNNDDFIIEIGNDMTPELQTERFWDGVVRATFDYITLLDEIEKEVGSGQDLPDFKSQNFGKVLKQVIEDNNLDK